MFLIHQTKPSANAPPGNLSSYRKHILYLDRNVVLNDGSLCLATSCSSLHIQSILSLHAGVLVSSWFFMHFHQTVFQKVVVNQAHVVFKARRQTPERHMNNSNIILRKNCCTDNKLKEIYVYSTQTRFSVQHFYWEYGG